jgi:hypothetical protein
MMVGKDPAIGLPNCAFVDITIGARHAVPVPLSILPTPLSAAPVPLFVNSNIPCRWFGMMMYACSIALGKCSGISSQHRWAVWPDIFSSTVPFTTSPNTRSLFSVHIVMKYRPGDV